MSSAYKYLYNQAVSVKPIQWLGSSRRDIQAFPTDARQAAGFQLYRVHRLHASEKKARKTPKREIEVAYERFRALLKKQRRKNAAKTNS